MPRDGLAGPAEHIIHVITRVSISPRIAKVEDNVDSYACNCEEYANEPHSKCADGHVSVDFDLGELLRCSL